MLHIFSEYNLIISILVELRTSKNPYNGSSPSYRTNSTDIINNKKPSWINALEAISPHVYCHIKYDVIYLLFIGETGWNMLRCMRSWGRDQWNSMRGFLWLGTLRGEWITCLDVSDHSTAYSHTSTSIWCCSHGGQANDPGLLALCANGQVINTSNVRMDLKLQNQQVVHWSIFRTFHTTDSNRICSWNPNIFT